jgi:hypothetical protein
MINQTGGLERERPAGLVKRIFVVLRGWLVFIGDLARVINNGPAHLYEIFSEPTTNTSMYRATLRCCGPINRHQESEIIHPPKTAT